VRAKDLIIVVTSVGTEDQALDVAHALVRNRQAACVNISRMSTRSTAGRGAVCDDTEWLCVIKTVAGQFQGVRETIQKVNTYELPEISRTASMTRATGSATGSSA